MPEGPEVKSITDALQPITGLSIFNIVCYKPIDGMKSELLPLKITKVWCYGKRIIFTLTPASVNAKASSCGTAIVTPTGNKDGAELFLYIFLAQTGVFRFVPGKHTRVTLGLGQDNSTKLSDLTYLYFDDKRSMGKMRLMTGDELKKDLSKFGPDIIEMKSYEPLYYHFMKSRSSARVLETLLMPEVFVSVGNYLRSDILHEVNQMARAHKLPEIDPLSPASSLTPEQASRLTHMAWLLVHRSYQAKGCSIRDYILPDLSKGKYETVIYGKKSIDSKSVVVTKDYQGRGWHHIQS